MTDINIIKLTFEDCKKSARKLGINFDISFDASENCFVMCNKDKTIKFDIDNCYDMLNVFNKMFGLLVVAIENNEQYNNQKIIYIGRLGEINTNKKIKSVDKT